MNYTSNAPKVRDMDFIFVQPTGMIHLLQVGLGINFIVLLLFRSEPTTQSADRRMIYVGGLSAHGFASHM